MPLVCGFCSLSFEGSTPACDFFAGKEEDSAPVCANCMFWID